MTPQERYDHTVERIKRAKHLLGSSNLITPSEDVILTLMLMSAIDDLCLTIGNCTDSIVEAIADHKGY